MTPYDLLAYIESREGKIERKIKSGFITRLLGLKSGELLGVTYAKLDLKACAVEPDDLFRHHTSRASTCYSRTQGS